MSSKFREASRKAPCFILNLLTALEPGLLTSSPTMKMEEEKEKEEEEDWDGSWEGRKSSKGGKLQGKDSAELQLRFVSLWRELLPSRGRSGGFVFNLFGCRKGRGAAAGRARLGPV